MEFIPNRELLATNPRACQLLSTIPIQMLQPTEDRALRALREPIEALYLEIERSREMVSLCGFHQKACGYVRWIYLGYVGEVCKPHPQYQDVPPAVMVDALTQLHESWRDHFRAGIATRDEEQKRHEWATADLMTHLQLLLVWCYVIPPQNEEDKQKRLELLCLPDPS